MKRSRKRMRVLPRTAVRFCNPKRTLHLIETQYLGLPYSKYASWRALESKRKTPQVSPHRVRLSSAVKKTMKLRKNWIEGKGPTLGVA